MQLVFNPFHSNFSRTGCPRFLPLPLTAEYPLELVQGLVDPGDRRDDALLRLLLGLGQKIFQEPTLSETLASVLKSAPDLDRLPASVPAAVRRLLDRCLRKDPRERLHDIADARLVLEDVAAGRIEIEPELSAVRRPLVAAAMVAACRRSHRCARAPRYAAPR